MAENNPNEGIMKRDTYFVETTGRGDVTVLRRRRKENGTGYSYRRMELKQFNQINKKQRKGNTMTNQKKETALFILNLIKLGMDPDEIREDILMERIEVRPEVIDYYREVVRCRRNGETEPPMPDFAELKKQAIAEQKARQAQNA